jgi:hypothetical protein
MRQRNKHFARNFANKPVDPQTARTAKRFCRLADVTRL